MHAHTSGLAEVTQPGIILHANLLQLPYRVAEVPRGILIKYIGGVVSHSGAARMQSAALHGGDPSVCRRMAHCGHSPRNLPIRCPKLVAGRVALLVAHLGGRAYSLRSAIVTALGHLIAKGFEGGPGGDADAQGARSAPSM